MVTKGETNPCNCPEGYSLIASTGKCQKIETTPPINNGGNYNICKINPGPYGTGGARFYDNVTTRPLPINANLSISAPGLPAPNLVDNSLAVVNYPFTSSASLWQGRMNAAGIWSCINNQSGNAPNNTGNPALPVQQWVGFSACVNIAETKTYCVALAADNRARFKVNGTLIAQLNPPSASSYTFIYLHVIPITLQAGVNVITLEGYNDGSQAGFVAEIYDDTPANLSAMTLLSQLTPKIVWSTASQVGGQWQTGTNIGYSCPEGYTLSTCDGLSCVKITTIDKPACNIKLSPCCKGVDDIIMSSEDLPGISYVNEGQYVCIENINPNVGCWLISITTDPINYAGTVTIGSFYDSCEDCEELGCRKCPRDTYFVLKDCCTNEPFTLPDKGPGNTPIPYTVVFVYNGTYSNNNSPSNLNGLGITHFVSQDETISYYGCWYLEEIPAIPEYDISFDWNKTLFTVETVPTCQDCSCCDKRYKLTNCEDPADFFIASGDLAQYVTGVVNIVDCPDVSYKVEEDFDCNPCESKPVVVKSCPPDGGYAGYCSYQYPVTTGIGGTVTIEYNNTTYSVPWSATPLIVVGSLNGLGIGNFSIDEYVNIKVIGQGTYGKLCVVKQSGTVCAEPMCVYNLLNFCSYGPIDPALITTGDITITIDGINYTSGVINLVGVAGAINIITWLNTLNLGSFGVNISGGQGTLEVASNHTYGNLVLPGLESPVTIIPDCVELVDPETACDACLPDPPPILPKRLIQRFIKPGYTTPGCDTEYTEKVNCNYSDQFYQIMLKDRYGITVCCDPNLEYWEIKKALLDFKANTPKTEDLVPPVICYCYTIAVSSGNINFKYISCQGDCTVVLVTEGNTINVCSQSYPYPVCSDSTTITGYTITASNTECETAEDCNPSAVCQCYDIISLGKDATYSYTACDGSIYIDVLLGRETNICARAGTVTGNLVDIQTSGKSCTQDLDCQPCTCYTIDASGSFSRVDVTYTDCETRQEVAAAGVAFLTMCAVDGTVSYTGDPIVTTGDICETDADCQVQLPCYCYRVISQGVAQITYTLCDGTPTGNFIGSPSLLNICAQEGTINVTSGDVSVILLGQDCSFSQCPNTCTCYSFTVINDVGSTIEWYDCVSGVLTSGVFNPGTHNLCARAMPTSVDAIVFTPGADCTATATCPL